MGRKARVATEYRVYELPLDVPALVLSGDEWHISDAISGRLHFHNTLEIGICHSGEGALAFEDPPPLKFCQDDITVIPQFIPHTTYSKKGTRSLWSYIFIDLTGIAGNVFPDGGFVPELTDNLPHIYLYSASRYPRISFIAVCLLEELTGKGDTYTAAVKSLSLLLYYELCRAGVEKPENEVRLRRPFILKPALEYIGRNYMKEISIRDLSEMCGLSENHFRRLFVSVMGTPPLKFINVTRIYRACILLDTTEIPINTLAEAVGFIAPVSFNRNFKEITGMSPGAYRRVASKNKVTLRYENTLSYRGWLKAELRPEYVKGE